MKIKLILANILLFGPVILLVLTHTSYVRAQDTGESAQIQQQINNPVPIGTDDCKAAQLDKDNCKLVGHIVNGINFLTAVAGMVIIFSIMYSGYEYMTARDNSGQIQQARDRIIWAIVALLIMIFMYGFLNFLVPGGVI